MKVLYLLVFALGASPGLSSNVRGAIESLRDRFYMDCPEDEADSAAAFLNGLSVISDDRALLIVEAVWQIPGCAGPIAYLQFLMETFRIPFAAVGLSESRFWVYVDLTILFLSQLANTRIVTQHYRPYVRSREFLWGLGDVLPRLAEIGSVPLIGEYNMIIEVIAWTGTEITHSPVLPSGLMAVLDLMHALNGAILDGHHPVSTMLEIAAGIRLFIDSADDRSIEYADVISVVHQIDQSLYASDEAIRAAHFALPAVYFSKLNNVSPGQPAWVVPLLRTLTAPEAIDPAWGQAVMVNLKRIWTSALNHATEPSRPYLVSIY